MGWFELMQMDEEYLDSIISGATTGREAIADLAELAEKGAILSTGNLAGSRVA